MRGASGAEPRRHAPGASPGGYGTSVAAMSSNTLAHADIATVCRARHRTTARPGARKPFPRSCCSRPFSLSRRGFRATFCEETHRPRRATTYDAPGSRAGAPRASPTPQDGCVHQRRDCFPFVILACVYCAQATVAFCCHIKTAHRACRRASAWPGAFNIRRTTHCCRANSPTASFWGSPLNRSQAATRHDLRRASLSRRPSAGALGSARRARPQRRDSFLSNPNIMSPHHCHSCSHLSTQPPAAASAERPQAREQAPTAVLTRKRLLCLISDQYSKGRGARRCRTRRCLAPRRCVWLLKSAFASSLVSSRTGPSAPRRPRKLAVLFSRCALRGPAQSRVGRRQRLRRRQRRVGWRGGSLGARRPALGRTRAGSRRRSTAASAVAS
jgi:hypothetical protein